MTPDAAERPMGPSAEKDVDYEALAEYLKSLAYPTRLEILDALRFPRTVGDIKVAPQRLVAGDNPERPVARQTLQAHLDKLVAAGLVRDEPLQVGERSIRRYSVNAQRLYAVTEELRRLSTRHAGRGADETTTHAMTEASDAARPRLEGPRLVLVHGVYEGKVFRLDPAFTVNGAWLIGRRRGLAVSLDYDPFVSNENSRITRDGDAFLLTDVTGSRNGTRVNWEPLAKDAPRRLHAGDVVGVGRSLLVFVPG